MKVHLKKNREKRKKEKKTRIAMFSHHKGESHAVETFTHSSRLADMVIASTHSEPSVHITMSTTSIHVHFLI
jgi:hypothetical protein